MSTFRKTVNLALVTSIVVASTIGCRGRIGPAAFIGGALLAGAIVRTAVVLSRHDAHIHDEYCRHHRMMHEGHWVYYYDGHWEYYEEGRWYYYPPDGQYENPPPPPPPPEGYAPPPGPPPPPPQ